MTRVLNPKACGFQWCSLGGGVEAHHQLFFCSISAKSWRHYKGKTIKPIISQKLWITQKKIICAKNDRRINSNFPCILGHYWKKINFMRIFLDANNSKTKDRKNLRYGFSFVSAHCESFMKRWPLLRMGICVFLVGKKPLWYYVYTIFI